MHSRQFSSSTSVPWPCKPALNFEHGPRRCGTHPSEWESGGYTEIQTPRERCSIIDHRALMELLGMPSMDALRRSHRMWVEEALARAEQVREAKWTESVAVGSRNFVETVKAKLGIRGKGPKNLRGRCVKPAGTSGFLQRWFHGLNRSLKA